jgi:hypothetical protein
VRRAIRLFGGNCPGSCDLHVFRNQVYDKGTFPTLPQVLTPVEWNWVGGAVGNRAVIRTFNFVVHFMVKVIPGIEPISGKNTTQRQAPDGAPILPGASRFIVIDHFKLVANC